METETKVVSWYAAAATAVCLIWRLVNTSLMARQVDARREEFANMLSRGVCNFAPSRPSSDVSTDDILGESLGSIILRVSLFFFSAVLTPRFLTLFTDRTSPFHYFRIKATRK